MVFSAVLATGRLKPLFLARSQVQLYILSKIQINLLKTKIFDLLSKLLTNIKIFAIITTLEYPNATYPSILP